MKKLPIIILFALPLWGLSQTQFHLSQYMQYKPFINVAAIGSFQEVNAGIVHKNQWTGFDGAPTYQAVNVSTPLGSSKNHLGLGFVNDKIGVNSSINLGLNYAYNLRLSAESNLSFGVSARLNMMQSRYSEISTDIDNDPLFVQNSPRITQPNFGFGTYYYTDKFHVGLGIPNLLENSIEYQAEFTGNSAFNFNAIHFYLHSGYNIDVSESAVITPNILVKQVGGAPTQVDINVNALFNETFGAGLGYRTANELSIMATYVIMEQFTVGYAYDLSFSELSNYSSGSHEIMLIYRRPGGGTAASLEIEE